MTLPDHDRRHGMQPSPPSGGRSGWLWIAVALVGGLLLLFLLADGPSNALANEDSQMQLLYLVALLVLVGGSTFFGWRQWPKGTVSKSVKQALVWVVIGFVLIVGYGFRTEFGMIYERVAADLRPHRGIAQGGGAITLNRDDRGHFKVEAIVDGVPVHFMVDTGASNVTLSQRDAQRLGFKTSDLKFIQRSSTANGTVWGAPVRLGEVVIGDIKMSDVHASVNGGELDESLLGLSFLDRLDSYEVRRGRLTLRQ